MQDVADGVPAAAALGVAVLQVGLTSLQLFAAFAAAAPVMAAVPFAAIGGDGQVAELLADPVLQGRAAQTAAAFGVPIQQLAGGDLGSPAAVALAAPDHGAALGSPVGFGEYDQPAKAHAPQITPGLHGIAAAVVDGAPLQMAGLHQQLAAAVTPAAPQDVSVLALIRWLQSGEPPEALPCLNVGLCFSHHRTLFRKTSYPAFCPAAAVDAMYQIRLRDHTER